MSDLVNSLEDRFSRDFPPAYMTIAVGPEIVKLFHAQLG